MKRFGYYQSLVPLLCRLGPSKEYQGNDRKMVMLTTLESYNEKARLLSKSGTFIIQAWPSKENKDNVTKVAMLITLESYNEKVRLLTEASTFIMQAGAFQRKSKQCYEGCQVNYIRILQ